MKIPPRLFPVTVQIHTPGGYDDYGQPLPGVSIDKPARIDTGQRIVRDQGGTEVSTNLTVKMPGSVDMDTVETMTVPDYGQRQVISWKKILGSREVEYTEVYVS